MQHPFTTNRSLNRVRDGLTILGSKQIHSRPAEKLIWMGRAEQVDCCRIDENRLEVSADQYRLGKRVHEIARQFAAVVFDDPSDLIESSAMHWLQATTPELALGRADTSVHSGQLYSPSVVKILLFVSVAALISSQAFAQSDGGLATPLGQEVNVSIGGYTYTEPGALSISIDGVKVGGEYTATLSLNKRRRWFGEADVRATIGDVTYTGWCSPFLIMPNTASPNGYELDFGRASPCSETGDPDWYLEGRVLAGKDFIGRTWGWSPYSGLGGRHLSNGTTGNSGYRTDEYLYVPVGVTARTRVVSHGVLSVNVEFDHLLHGWQKTRGSQLGGGDVPATTTAPAFTINSFSDVSFSQSGGWAFRAAAKYQVTRHWSLEPFFIHWSVSASPVNDQTLTFTVNHVTAREQVGFYEPFNTTDEFGVKFGFHF
jgi:hypothetical protein